MTKPLADLESLCEGWDFEAKKAHGKDGKGVVRWRSGSDVPVDGERDPRRRLNVWTAAVLRRARRGR